MTVGFADVEKGSLTMKTIFVEGIVSVMLQILGRKKCGR